MSSKFFTNKSDNSLFDKFRGISDAMANFYSFHAVVGFFRASGYFKLRDELEQCNKIQILVGINIDNIFKKHNKALLMLGNDTQAKEVYTQDLIDDIKSSKYSAEIEKGILQLCEDLHSGKVEMKIHPTKNLHAKFYLCLPENHSEHSDGWVIMGSSNISESGLGITQPPRYELNVAMKDFDDVDFCKKEFDELWKDGIIITPADIDGGKKQTHLGEQPTPFELYIKMLIDTFGDQVEDDFSITLPDGIADLKYQKDAVIQGYQMMQRHNGFFLADVVGLGKTLVATMIAKRYVESNGRNTKILVIYPPVLETNWKETFKKFGIDKKAQFIKNGSLSKVLDGKDNYFDKEEFDVVIVDEAHNFRGQDAERYDELQKICKSPRNNVGLLKDEHKKIMLLSATPLNNSPEDLRNLIGLFQDMRRSSIDGINDLQAFFAPLVTEYKKIMKDRKEGADTKGVDELYEKIRNKVLDKITVRRTRNNIWNDEYYRKDLESQKIKFPEILPPNDLTYKLGDNGVLFFNSMEMLTNDKDGVSYARYRAVEFIKDAAKLPKTIKNPKSVGENLKGIYRTHMVKRLESSFYAFKKSLDSFIGITNDMIKMFADGRVIIAPELKIKDFMAKGWEIDRILEYAENKGYKKEEITFAHSDFDDKFLGMLKSDFEKLNTLKQQWNGVQDDPKLDLFVKKLQEEMFDAKKNPTGKLVVFSESVDTLNYLEKELKERLNRQDILKVSSDNRDKDKKIIRECFDANYEDTIDMNKYNIIIASDVLAEGVNLHRANVIVNYDTPWNATRLMQRIGRVNRIGSVAGAIYNYMFYPSAEGNAQIQLYQNALIKLQGFHSALGEDAQIYSREEIVKEFKLYNPNVKDETDKNLQLLREVRELYNTDRKLYKKIKALPMKSRVARNATKLGKSDTTLAFIQSNRKTEYYLVGKSVKSIDFLTATDIMRAERDEKAVDFASVADTHYAQVNLALEQFKKEIIVQQDTTSIKTITTDKGALEALNFLRQYRAQIDDSDIKQKIDSLKTHIENGTFAPLVKKIRTIAQEYKKDPTINITDKQYEIDIKINDLYAQYGSATIGGAVAAGDESEPNIVISESFK